LGFFYHGAGHNAVGGIMSSFASPADPMFWGWHGHIDQILDAWLATPTGQAWAASNPDHWLTGGTNEYAGGHAH
jgi:hypothetical protein